MTVVSNSYGVSTRIFGGIGSDNVYLSPFAPPAVPSHTLLGYSAVVAAQVLSTNASSDYGILQRLDRVKRISHLPNSFVAVLCLCVVPGPLFKRTTQRADARDCHGLAY